MAKKTFGVNNTKSLYDYQETDIGKIFERIEQHPDNYNLLYQLPTGGGKTVIFSELVRRYITATNKKVVILTHRIELCKQTSKMLKEFDVKSKIINSKVKKLPEQDKYKCFVAMVETLNNRLQDEIFDVKDVGLVIIDEAHYNSFRKLFKYFEGCFMLGVTATPLSSNIKLPMYEVYDDLIVGEDIPSLIKRGFLAKAKTLSYDVHLGTLQVGMTGDYTVRSSEELYGNMVMQGKLLEAYEAKAKGTKTLIFNNGIRTSEEVYTTFKRAGYDVEHLDNTHTKEERRQILKWFNETPGAILTSVSILTTGFDEPSVETIILNRATKSLTLYYQMIGRGSRVFGDKKEFTVIDLGNNATRFGLWSEPVDWHRIFKSPDYFLEHLRSDEEIEREFKYVMPDELRERFSKTEDIKFDVRKEYEKVMKTHGKSKMVIENSIAQHSKMCIENSEDVFDARELAKLLKDDIEYRVRIFSYCIINNTKNYKNWLQEEYMRKLRLSFNGKF